MAGLTEAVAPTAADSSVAVDTVTVVRVGVDEAIPALDLAGTRLAVALIVVATAVVGLVGCPSPSPLLSTRRKTQILNEEHEYTRAKYGLGE